jgi:hypothetical protein
MPPKRLMIGNEHSTGRDESPASCSGSLDGHSGGQLGRLALIIRHA